MRNVFPSVPPIVRRQRIIYLPRFVLATIDIGREERSVIGRKRIDSCILLYAAQPPRHADLFALSGWIITVDFEISVFSKLTKISRSNFGNSPTYFTPNSAEYSNYQKQGLL